ncbi:MAG: histone deacetylase [Rhodothermaceae bacterium]|nr:MAG: histone deacetylase [Rhodothermaceae bacterium]
MRTAFAHNPGHEAHAEEGHPERPARLDAILSLLRDDPLWDRLHRAEPVAADPDTARLVHTDDYLRRLETTAQQGGVRLDPDTYVTPESLDVALRALGAVLGVTRAVIEGEADNGFAAVRPPGHHARPGAAMGFCLLANVALAVRWARAAFGAERFVVLDVDVHHGNGTQEVFYEDPNVLFISTHQYPFYPGTGAADETGDGRGRGATINLPFPAGTGDDAFRTAFRRILTPRVLRFRPEMIFVSAGYDAHWRDPIGGLHLSVAGLADLVRYALEWADACCDGRLVAVLEGGYDTDVLAHSVRATLARLEDPDAEIEDPFGPSPWPDADVDRLLDDLAGFHIR